MKTERVIPINTRYPQHVHAGIGQLAQKDRRSFQEQVIWILEEYIKQHLQKEGRQ